MSTVIDTAFYLFLCGPVIALMLCGWIVASDHPTYVSASAIFLGVVVAIAFISYWLMWGHVFDDADGSVSAPVLGINVAVWTGVVALVGLIGLVCLRAVSGMVATRRCETVA